MKRCARHFYVLLMPLFCVLVVGCAWTQVVGVVDPDFHGVSYHKILVFANVADLGMRAMWESIFVAQLQATGVHVVPSSSIFVATRDYTEAERGQLVQDHGFDAVLYIVSTAAGSSQTYIPPTFHTYGSGVTSGGITTYRGTTYPIGGYNVSKPYANFQLELLDSRDFRKAWVATASSRGNAFADFNTLI